MVTSPGGFDLATENQIKQLELQLANEIALDLHGDDEKQAELLQRIKETQRQLELLRSQV